MVWHTLVCARRGRCHGARHTGGEAGSGVEALQWGLSGDRYRSKCRV
jgi:hypothetical protein